MDHALHLLLVILGLAAFFFVPPTVAVAILAVLIATGLAIFAAVNRASRLPPRTGNESVVGSVGMVVEWNQLSGLIRHRGEIWRATSSTLLRPGEPVRILRAEGTMLHVRPENG
jgi:membrane-bound ClpP family serine protease